MKKFGVWNHSLQSGQAGLVVLLLTVVTLTIGISIASRSTTDVKIARQEEESNRALNAAETGIEQALSQDLEVAAGQNFDVCTDLSVNYTIEKVNILETRLFEGVSAQVDVTGANNSRSIVIRWAKEGDCSQNPAAILVTVFNRAGGNTTTRSTAYKPCSNPGGDGFSEIGPATSGNGFFRSVTINMQNNDQIVRIKPIYNDTSLQVQGQGGGWNLPTQYYRVRSVAENDLGDEVRAVQVNRTKPAAPSLFDFVLFSDEAIIKAGN